MRTLELNKSTLWLVNPTGEVDEVDGDGFYTGSKTISYSTPIEIKINIFPATGEITEEVFGKNASLDMIGITTDLELQIGSLLFLTQPVSNYYSTYDFSVSMIKKSLHVKRYGLKRRI